MGSVIISFCQSQNAVALERMREVYADSAWSKEQWLTSGRICRLPVSMDILKINTLKTCTPSAVDQH